MFLETSNVIVSNSFLTKAIFLAGTVIGFLALTISLIDGVDLHVMYRLTLKFGLAGVLLSVLAAFLSMLNTVLFAMLSVPKHKTNLENGAWKIMYQPEISLVFCMLLVLAANWCAGLSALFFFIQYNRHMVYVLVGLVAFSLIGYGPPISLVLLVFYTFFPPKSKTST